MDIFRHAAERLASIADVQVNGPRPCDIQVRDERMFRRVILGGSTGLGEAYVDGLWTCEDLEELGYRFARARLEEVAGLLPGGLWRKSSSILFNQQTKRRSLRVARRHYDFDNDLFSAFLGAHMNYSCGYFRDTEDLDVAQRQKMNLICRKLGLAPGERLLDVGGGFGELARHAAAHHGARVTSINISEEQMRLARERCRGLDVEVVRCDYRDLRGTFDKVAAIAVFTHVGYRNYRAFMEVMRRVLAPGGVLVVEGVWGNKSTTHIDPWIDRHIFPGGMFPSGAQTFKALEGLFVAEDLHNFGPDYVKTLRAWNRNFQEAWPELRARHSESVRRTFELYFLMSAGHFRARALQHWHLVLTPQGAAQPASRLS